MNETKISWTDATWNPVHGCTRISDGCRNCYAEALSLRYGFTKKPWIKQNENENVLLKRHKLREPYRLKKPSKIFVNSMSDLFHPLIPHEYKVKIFDVMVDNPQHIFQVLTKRPHLAAQWNFWPDNVWMGTSVEDARVIDRINQLRQCGAKTLFVSAEPLIGAWPNQVDLTGYDWVIVGGESGKNYRPMKHNWARHILNLCLNQNIAFFFKQSSASRTEMGTSLQMGNGEFMTWQQYPDRLIDPIPAESHKYV